MVLGLGVVSPASVILGIFGDFGVFRGVVLVGLWEVCVFVCNFFRWVSVLCGVCLWHTPRVLVCTWGVAGGVCLVRLGGCCFCVFWGFLARVILFNFYMVGFWVTFHFWSLGILGSARPCYYFWGPAPYLPGTPLLFLGRGFGLCCFWVSFYLVPSLKCFGCWGSGIFGSLLPFPCPTRPFLGLGAGSVGSRFGFVWSFILGVCVFLGCLADPYFLTWGVLFLSLPLLFFVPCFCVFLFWWGGFWPEF